MKRLTYKINELKDYRATQTHKMCVLLNNAVSY